MKGLFGIVGLLLSLAIVGMLVKKQWSSTQQLVPALQLPAELGVQAGASAPGATVKEQSQQIQQQVEQAVQAAMQKPHADPDEK